MGGKEGAKDGGGAYTAPLGYDIHLCLFAKFDFKYLQCHKSWLKQITCKVLLSENWLVRRMAPLEAASMFYLVKYKTIRYTAATLSSFKQSEKVKACSLSLE